MKTTVVLADFTLIGSEFHNVLILLWNYANNDENKLWISARGTVRQNSIWTFKRKTKDWEKDEKLKLNAEVWKTSKILLDFS